MLITVTSTAEQADDLGYLLHKHPQRAQRFDLAVGTAHVFYPEATAERCTVALLLEVDTVALVRGRQGGDSGFSLAQYVNDRPYAASSMTAVALGSVFRTAMAGRCDRRPDLPAQSLPLQVHIPVLPVRGGPDVARRLFEPLGWDVAASPLPLDPQFPAWGDSPYVDLTLTGRRPLADALTQLYVLLPVLDDAKHYWVGPDEVDKLVRAGGDWLAAHPARGLITDRYLAHRRDLVLSAVGRLAEIDDTPAEALDDAVPDETSQTPGAETPGAETPGAGTPRTETPGEGDDATEPPRPSLAQQRLEAVLATLKDVAARRVVDIGCGEGRLLRELIADPAFTQVIGADVSHRALEIAARRLRLDRLPDRVRERVSLLQTSLTYRDARLAGFDAMVLMEVIEHVDPPRLAALAATVFGSARPGSVVVTTPNVEYNVRYPTLGAGAMRHRDHRFEWTRQQFAAWAEATAQAYGYAVEYRPVGEVDPEVGPPTQMAVFRTAVAGDDETSGEGEAA